MAIVTSTSVEETESLGEAWGQALPPGRVLLLTGELGSGKTQLVRGLARGLGCRARVHSPTFAIINLYADGRLPLAHLDLYRLESPQDLVESGVLEFLEPDGVAVIEWGEKLLRPGPGGEPSILSNAHLPGNVRRVELEVLSDTVRRIVYEGLGA